MSPRDRALVLSRGRALLRAYVRLGSIKAAADDQGWTEAQARKLLSAYYRETGCANAVQAAYHLDRAA